MSEKLRVSCMSCGATNNYPLDALGKKIVCGRCKNLLHEPGAVIEPSAERVYTLSQKAGLPVLVDFYSPTCAPCHIMHPVVESFAKRRAGELMVIKVNVDQHPDLAAAFSIQGVPTFVVLLKGSERARTSGAMSDADFSLWAMSVV